MRDPFKNKPLSFGQVVYAITGSASPHSALIDQLRYLRRLGVPFTDDESQGSGHRMAYTFDHLFECGLSTMALDFLKPQEISQIIVNHRVELRRIARRALTMLVEDEWASLWKAWPSDRAQADDVHIVLTDRYDPDPCTFYVWRKQQGKTDKKLLSSIHQLPQTARIQGRHLPLKSTVATLVFRAMQAPETKPGRQ